MTDSAASSSEFTPADAWRAAANELDEEAADLKEQLERLYGRSRRYRLLAEHWDKEHGQ